MANIYWARKKIFLQCVLLPLSKTIRDNTFFFLPFIIIFDVTMLDILFVYPFSDTSSSRYGWCICIYWIAYAHPLTKIPSTGFSFPVIYLFSLTIRNTVFYVENGIFFTVIRHWDYTLVLNIFVISKIVLFSFFNPNTHWLLHFPITNNSQAEKSADYQN